MGRDLAHSHWLWSDVGGALPFVQFVQFVLYAPPGSAIFQAVGGGYSIEAHHLASLVEIGSYLAWTKSKSAAEGEAPPDFSVPRPGKFVDEPEPFMTIGQYMELAGLEG